MGVRMVGGWLMIRVVGGGRGMGGVWVGVRVVNG